MNCGLHICQSKCHQISDHSKMPCEEVMTSYCPNGHAQTWECYKKQPAACCVCDQEVKRAAEELQKKRDAEQQEHDEEMAELREEMVKLREEMAKLKEEMAKLQEKMDAQIQVRKDLRLAKDREAFLKQQEQDIEDVEERSRQKVAADKKRQEDEVKRQKDEAKRQQEEVKMTAEQATPPSNSVSTTFIETVRSAVNTRSGTPSNQPSPEDTSRKEKKRKESEAGSEWQRRKYIRGVTTPPIDAIMEMIGLEEVKKQVLRIMDKVDVNIRQGTSLSKERFNAVLLGNPGTGIILLFPNMRYSPTIMYRENYCSEALRQIPGFCRYPSQCQIRGDYRSQARK